MVFQKGSLNARAKFAISKSFPVFKSSAGKTRGVWLGTSGTTNLWKSLFSKYRINWNAFLKRTCREKTTLRLRNGRTIQPLSVEIKSTAKNILKAFELFKHSCVLFWHIAREVCLANTFCETTFSLGKLEYIHPALCIEISFYMVELL